MLKHIIVILIIFIIFIMNHLNYSILKISNLQLKMNLMIISLKAFTQINYLHIINLLSLQKIIAKIISIKLIIIYLKMKVNYNYIILISVQIYQIIISLLVIIINSLFLHLNPTLIQKKNVYFINYHLFIDSKLFHFFEQSEIPRIMVGFSRFEEYSAYKGLNRYSSKSSEYENYVELYIMVDNQKVVIRRKYQDFMEFFADHSSFLTAIYEIYALSQVFTPN